MMKRSILLFLVFLNLHLTYSQSQQQWKGYFSYNEIKDVSQSENQLYVAAENAVFTKDLNTNQSKTINTIDGLSSQVISSIYHSLAFHKTLVGYENGLMIVINDSDGKILNVVDIINKQLPANIKKINHFNEYNGIVYISCDFGIVQYNLNTLQFGDTYFIGTTKSEIVVTQTTIFNGYIFASTLDEGIKQGLLTNSNLIDATQWQVSLSGSFSGVTMFNNSIFATSTNGTVYRSTDGSAFSNFGSTLSPSAIDLRQGGNYLVITTPSVVYVYDSQLNLSAQINSNQVSTESVIFSCATVVGQTLNIGTTENGVLSAQLNNLGTFNNISPNGPFKNNIFSITASEGDVFATYGGYDVYFTPFVRSYGFSRYKPENGWNNIPYSGVDKSHDLVRVTVNPTNKNEYFVSSYFNGLLKYDNEILTTHYDQYNSGLESLYYAPDPSYQSVRIEQSVFDKSGNLWMTNAFVKNGIKVLKKNGEWQPYDMSSILNQPTSGRFGRMSIDKNGTKWITSYSEGLIGFNETKGNLFRKITTDSSSGNLPDAATQVAAIDNNNQLWIGTRSGLRVLSSVDRFVTGSSLNTNQIIILEDGVAQELMYQQNITDIVVDGANNKWIGTLDAGVFLVSPDGQKTLYHFTSANSPLPSNAINDIDINGNTGEVFFATVNGLVSFKGSAVDAKDDLNNVNVYPNPVRPNYDGTVKIVGLTDKADVKITDVEGNLVYEVVSEGGSVEWDTTAFGKYKVHSGVYMILIATQDGGATKVKKVMIVR